MDFASFDVVTVGSIIVLCYLVGLLVKTSGIDNKWIPVSCGISGMFFGIIAMVVMPDFPASDYITAAAIGAASGLSATGINQAIKQLTNK